MHNRFVSIWFPHLATDWFVAKNPLLKKTAFVLQGSFHGRLVVTAASPKAQSAGINSGMTIADARALLPSLQILNDRPNLISQLLQRIAEWCIRFTPSAAADAPEGILLDASGCTQLWGGDEAYIADITKRLAARGYTARVSIADTIGAAWAVARFGGESLVVEKGGTMKALLPLPAAALRLETQSVERLLKLGLTKIEDFILIPPSALRRRFGQNMVLLIEQALGKREGFFKPINTAEPYEERLPCMEPIISRSAIEKALELLLQQLCNRIIAEGKGLRAAYFRCYRMDSTAQGIDITTSLATCNKEHLFHLFSLKIDSIEPKSGIELFVLAATKVEEYIPKQESLWQASGSINMEKLSQLMDRVTGKYGQAVVQRFLPAEHHLPERSYQQATSLEEQKSIDWSTAKRRPVTLLTVPETITVTAPIPDYPPMNFRHKGKLHTIIKADGPERIEQEWWITEGEHRDYYCVEDESGARYWLYRSGHYTGDKNNQWYLHGYFA